jgi:hypothetical protein
MARKTLHCQRGFIARACPGDTAIEIREMAGYA